MSCFVLVFYLIEYAFYRSGVNRSLGTPCRADTTEPRHLLLGIHPHLVSGSVGCHNARKLSLGWVSRDRQAARWYSLISPLTVVRRLIRAVMLMALPGSCIGG